MSTKKTNQTITVLNNTVPVTSKGVNYDTIAGHRAVIVVAGLTFVSDKAWPTPNEAVGAVRKVVAA